MALYDLKCALLEQQSARTSTQALTEQGQGEWFYMTTIRRQATRYVWIFKIIFYLLVKEDERLNTRK